MKDPLLRLGPSDLRSLANALKTGHLSAPFADLSLRRFLSDGLCREVGATLRAMAALGMPPNGIARAMELIADARAERPPLEQLVEVVSTTPGAAGIGGRNTSVVVRDLFRNAETSVVVVGYAVHQGQKVFETLAERMRQRPDLRVRMFLDVQRPRGDTTMAADLERRFAHRFRTTEWPAGCRYPEIWYDPRSLAMPPSATTALHAKTIVVDGEQVFVSSANFTEAAQERNIELGLLLRSKAVGERIVGIFEKLRDAGLLRQVI